MSVTTSQFIRLNEEGALKLERRLCPTPSSGELLVQIKAFGVNRADLLQRAGHYPAPAGAPQDILGLEFAGRVVEGAGRWRAGDRVMGICAGGGYSEHICVHEGCLLSVPEGWSWAEAAAFPEVYYTAFDALRQAELAPGERLLIHAIGSGVGGAAAQLGAWMGAEVVGTTRSAWKQRRALEELPIKGAALISEGDFAPLEGYGPFDVIIDFVGAAYLKQNLGALRAQGRLIIVGLLGGARAELPLGLLLAKRLRVQGTVLRSRELLEKMQLSHELERLVLPALLRGQLSAPHVDRQLRASPEGLDEAHHLLRQGLAWSKLVALWDE